MRLFRLPNDFSVENKVREPDLHCINKKTGAIACFTRPQILRTHTHTHTHKKNHNKKLVSICLPSLPQPLGPGPKALDFSRRLPWGRMVEDKKEQSF